jgi:hypothetical protein
MVNMTGNKDSKANVKLPFIKSNRLETLNVDNAKKPPYVLSLRFINMAAPASWMSPKIVAMFAVNPNPCKNAISSGSRITLAAPAVMHNNAIRPMSSILIIFTRFPFYAVFLRDTTIMVIKGKIQQKAD